jgi:uncharacterized protein
MEINSESISEPVTALIVRYVKKDRIEEFEAWIRGMTLVASKFEGFLGSNVIRPRDKENPEYVIVARFDKYEHLKAFMTSVERAEYLKKSEGMTTGEISVQEMHGFGSFFSLPERSVSSSVPAKYKMSVLTIMALYIPLLVISTLVASIFRGFPRPLLVLFTLIVLVPIMTYFIMPWTTRLFRFWLFPKTVSRK